MLIYIHILSYWLTRVLAMLKTQHQLCVEEQQYQDS